MFPLVLFQIQSYLNELSRNLLEKYGTSVIYDPDVLTQAKGAHSPSKKILYISEFTATTGEPDLTLLHEIRHVAMNSKELLGEASLLNGFALKTVPKWPWGEKSRSAYTSFFSLQEVSTWYQGFKYRLIMLKQLSRLGSLSYPKAHSLIKEFNNYDPLAILNDNLAMMDYEIHFYSGGPRYNGFTEVSEGKGIIFCKIGLGNLLTHTIPKSFLIKYMSNQEQDLTSFYKQIKGQKLMNDIIVDYLVELKSKIENYKLKILAHKKYIDYIQKQLVFNEAQNKPISDLNFLFDALLGKTSKHNEFPKVRNLPEVSEISALPITGLDFTGLNSVNYKIEIKTFDDKLSPFVNLDQVQTYLIRSLKYSDYTKYDFEFEINNKSERLLLEAGPMGHVNELLGDFTDLGIKFKSVQITGLSDDRNSRLYLLPATIQNYINLTPQEINVRNLFRILSILQDQ